MTEHQEQESQRWEANAATKEGVSRMRALLEEQRAGTLPTGALRDSLEERMALIFERCTMEGEAHEALHAYLLPLISMHRDLSDEPRPEELDSIAGHLKEFDARFR